MRNVGTPSFTVIDSLPESVTAERPRRERTEQERQGFRDEYNRKMGKDIRVADPAKAPDFIEEDAVALTDDLAATVVRKTMRRIAAGKAEPSIKEGLAAQTILDRRAEKAADRRFMLALSQALAGGGAQTPAKLLPEPDEGVIEGDFEELSLAPAHLREEP